MNEEIIKEICEDLSQSINRFDDKSVLFSDSRYKAFPFSKDNFHQLREHYSPINIAFVDGGNAEIISSPNFCIQFIRIYYNVFEKNKKIKTKRISFYLMTKAVFENQRIFYKSKMFPIEEGFSIDPKYLDFDSMDQSIKSGVHRAEISRVGNAVRRFAELSLARELTRELKTGDIIILDGTLQSSFTHESHFLESLYESAKKYGTLVMSVAKTCRLFTDSGNSLIPALNKMAPSGSWYYHPLVEINHPDHKAEMFLAKLHENSDYVFRIELFKEQKPLVDIEKVLGVIAKNSVDPVFLGYPYGLIDADKFAQITEEEKKLLQIRFKAGFKGKEMKDYLNTLNAHDILNRL